MWLKKLYPSEYAAIYQVIAMSLCKQTSIKTPVLILPSLINSSYFNNSISTFNVSANFTAENSKSLYAMASLINGCAFYVKFLMLCFGIIHLIDKISPNKLLIIACFFNAIGISLYAFADSMIPLIIMRIINGIDCSLFSALNYKFIYKSARPDRDAELNMKITRLAFSFMPISAALAVRFCPSIGALIFSKYGQKAVLLVPLAVLLNLLFATLLRYYFSTKENLRKIQPSFEKNEINVNDQISQEKPVKIRKFLANSFVIILLMNQMFGPSNMGGRETSLTIYLKERFLIKEDQIGYVFLQAGVSSFALFFLAIVIQNYFPNYRYIGCVVCLFIYSFSWFGVFFMNNWREAALLLFFGNLLIINSSLVSSLLIELTKLKYGSKFVGRAGTIREISSTIGQLFFGTVSGFISGYLGFKGFSIMIGSAAILLFLINFKIKKFNNELK